jgi:hypothetical protein
MATVRQSITALFEQSQKSVSDGQAMFAVIESEAVASADAAEDSDFDIPTSDERPSIAHRFDDLRELAEREMHGEAGRREATQTSGAMTGNLDELIVPNPYDNPDDGLDDSIGDTSGGHSGTGLDADVDGRIALTADDTPETTDSPDIEANIDTGMNGETNTNDEATTPDLAMPSEPPAPAGGDVLSDLDIGDIQELVRQAWEDETALGASESKAAPEARSKEAGTDESGENPDIEATHIESTMEEIAAAVVKSGDVPVPVDLTAIKTDLVVAMRAELQAVMEADLRPMIKAAIAEALQERPTTQPKPRAKKAASGKAAKTKAVTRAKKAPAAKKSND